MVKGWILSRKRLMGTLVMGVAAVVILAVAPGGFGSPQSPTTASGATAAQVRDALAQIHVAEGQINIVEVAPELGNPFYTPIVFGFAQAGKDLKVHTQYVGPPTADPQRQSALIQAAIQKRVSAIIVDCPNPTAMVPAINAAVKAGIITVTAQVDCPTSKRAFFYGHDFDSDGVIQATLLKKWVTDHHYPQPLKTAIGICAPGFSDLNSRHVSFVNTVKKIGLKIDNLGVFNSSLDTSKNLIAYQNEIAAHPDINVLYAECGLDTQNAGTMSKRGKNSKGQKLLAIGYDLLPITLQNVKSGDLLWTVGQDPYSTGYMPVKFIVDFLRNHKPLPKGWVHGNAELVTAQSGLGPTVSKFKGLKLRMDIDAVAKREARYYKK